MSEVLHTADDEDDVLHDSKRSSTVLNPVSNVSLFVLTHCQVFLTQSSFPHTIVLVDHLDQVIQSWQCGGLWESGAQLSFGRLMVSC